MLTNQILVCLISLIYRPQDIVLLLSVCELFIGLFSSVSIGNPTQTGTEDTSICLPVACSLSLSLLQQSLVRGVKASSGRLLARPSLAISSSGIIRRNFSGNTFSESGQGCIFLASTSFLFLPEPCITMKQLRQRKPHLVLHSGEMGKSKKAHSPHSFNRVSITRLGLHSTRSSDPWLVEAMWMDTFIKPQNTLSPSSPASSILAVARNLVNWSLGF